MNNKIPIITTFLEALSFPYKYHSTLLKVGLPLIVTGGLLTVLPSVFPDAEASVIKTIFRILLTIAFGFSLVIAVVACHRIFLLGSNVVEESSLLNWTGNELRYAGWWLFIGLCTCLVVLPFLFIFMPFMLSSLGESFESHPVFLALIGLVNIPIYYVASRWSLVLPSSAISIHGKSLTWSWELSSGNGWRLALLIGFLPFLTDTIFNLLTRYDSMIMSLLQGALWLVVGVVEVGLLSLSYKFLVGIESCESTE